MICCKKTIPLFTHIYQRITVKTMATYGIQTRHGIFYLSKKSSGSETLACPEVSNKNIELFIPHSNENSFSKLMSLHLLNQSCMSNEIPCIKGFYVDGQKFEKAIYFCDVKKELLNNFDTSILDRVRFEWDGEQHVLKYTSVDGESVGDKYILRKFDAYHPLIDSPEYRPVHSSYQQVIPFLELIATYDKSLCLSQNIQSINKQNLHSKHTLKHPFIVVEGLDGTGKSTLTQNLSKHIHGVSMVTPPPIISHMRKHFDKLPEIYRRSFYALSNYIAADEVLEHCKTKAVVMDRFWHSTTAYAIANEVGCGMQEYIPPKGHHCYTWPNDLLQPSAVIFLTTIERDRDLRVNEREELTDEEKYISVSRTFRARIMETYRRIGHPKWIEIDTGGTQEETLEKVVTSLQQNGISW